MQNAHLRMGKLTFARETRDTITNVTVGMNCLVADPPDAREMAALHLVSVFGGDQDIGAVVAAARESLHFRAALGTLDFAGTLGERPVIYRASLQLFDRKRPVRHAVLLSKALFETTLGANSGARRTVLFDRSQDFVLHRLAVRFGLPVLPEWAEWFAAELGHQGLIEDLIGLNCDPIAVKGSKRRMLRILAQGLRRKVIAIPAETPAPFVPSEKPSSVLLHSNNPLMAGASQA